MKNIFLRFIYFYQIALAPWLRPSCRFVPSCSHYWGEAITAHGTLRGIALGVWRLLRCQPFGRAGLDPVPEIKNDKKCHPERSEGSIQDESKRQKRSFALRAQDDKLIRMAN